MQIWSPEVTRVNFHLTTTSYALGIHAIILRKGCLSPWMFYDRLKQPNCAEILAAGYIF